MTRTTAGWALAAIAAAMLATGCWQAAGFVVLAAIAGVAWSVPTSDQRAARRRNQARPWRRDDE